MNENSLLNDGVQVAGVSGLLFVLFYYYMRQQFELFRRAQEDQNERNEKTIKATVETFEKLLEEQRIRDHQAYELNREFMETLQHQAGVVSRMEHKIDNMTRDRRDR